MTKSDADENMHYMITRTLQQFHHSFTLSDNSIHTLRLNLGTICLSITYKRREEINWAMGRETTFVSMLWRQNMYWVPTASVPMGNGMDL